MASEPEKPDADQDQSLQTEVKEETGAKAETENKQADDQKVNAQLESPVEVSLEEAPPDWPQVEFQKPDFGSEDTGFPEDVSLVSQTPVALYDLDDIRAVLGLARLTGMSRWEAVGLSEGTEHQDRLTAILQRGERARWRHALGPAEDTEAKIASLMSRAPHFAELGSMLQTNARAARTIGLPLFIHPILLIGEPGAGKTWFLSKLADLLGLPFRSYSMSMSTLGEGIQGSHPSWRNAETGLVGKTLLREKVANPLIFVDEFDKVVYGSWNSDPYRPFYTLLDPSGSQRFTDEYLGFPLDASKALWVMAANDAAKVPAPILDRLTVLHVPPMTAEQRVVVIQSIYAEANTKHLSFFEPELEGTALSELATLNPRRMRIAIEIAMAKAAADGRRTIAPADIQSPKTGQSEAPPAKGAARPRGKAAKQRLN